MKDEAERQQFWTRVADEKCECGHLKSQHGVHYGAPGQGACTVSNCPCSQFTWKAWVMKKRGEK